MYEKGLAMTTYHYATVHNLKMVYRQGGEECSGFGAAAWLSQFLAHVSGF